MIIYLCLDLCTSIQKQVAGDHSNGVDCLFLVISFHTRVSEISADYKFISLTGIWVELMRDF